MTTRLLLILTLLASPLFAEPFPDVAQTLTAGREFTLRGIVNPAVVPVPDAVESGPTQSGFFLFTPYPHDAAFIEDGEEINESNLTVFQITGTDDLLTELAKAAGKPVEVVATPFPAHTRHHRTPVLLEVKEFRILAK